MATKNVPRDHITPFLITEDGRVNIQLTEQNFHEKLLKHIAVIEADDEIILSCLDTLFDEFKGVSFNREAIASAVFRLCGAKNSSLKSPSCFPRIAKRTNELVQVGVATGKYTSKQGNSSDSGTYRTCDRPAKPATATDTTPVATTETTETK
jgi:hypothetical protein